MTLPGTSRIFTPCSMTTGVALGHLAAVMPVSFLQCPVRLPSTLCQHVPSGREGKGLPAAHTSGWGGRPLGARLRSLPGILLPGRSVSIYSINHAYVSKDLWILILYCGLQSQSLCFLAPSVPAVATGGSSTWLLCAFDMFPRCVCVRACV